MKGLKCQNDARVDSFAFHVSQVSGLLRAKAVRIATVSFGRLVTSRSLDRTMIEIVIFQCKTFFTLAELLNLETPVSNEVLTFCTRFRISAKPSKARALLRSGANERSLDGCLTDSYRGTDIRYIRESRNRRQIPRCRNVGRDESRALLDL